MSHRSGAARPVVGLLLVVLCLVGFGPARSAGTLAGPSGTSPASVEDAVAVTTTVDAQRRAVARGRAAPRALTSRLARPARWWRRPRRRRPGADARRRGPPRRGPPAPQA